jgi:basic membrane protein A
MFKKILSVVLVVAMIASLCVVFASCETAKANELKVGFIFLHDENSTYDLNFINAAKAAVKALGLTDDQVFFKTNVPEDAKCLDTAKELVEEGCTLIFADSFGHEQYLLEAAKLYPEVQFCHATGTMAHTEKLANFHNAFAAIYQGRYLAGIAAGMKLNEMIADGTIPAGETPRMGYVGAHPYAEVISGYTSFYLGARSVCPDVVMDVDFTNSWYDEAKEREMANKFIANGCHLISQHADSMGAPSACEEAGIPNVSYNGSTKASCPDTYIVSSYINWQPYFELIINAVKNGEKIPTDYCGTIATGSVALTEINEAVAAAGTAQAIEDAKAKLAAGTLRVFDVTTFTVNGAPVADNQMADVDTDSAYTPDTDVVDGGYYHESEYRSAPYFDLGIDGIIRLDK